MPAVTKSNLERIARAIRENLEGGTQRDVLSLEMADIFAQGNPAFDRARFLGACGMRDYGEHAPCFYKGGCARTPKAHRNNKLGHAFVAESVAHTQV